MNKRGIGILLIIIIAILAFGAIYLISKTQLASPQFSPLGKNASKNNTGNFVSPENATGVKKLPDLIVQELSASHSFNGSIYSVYTLATIKNIGDATAGESYTRFLANYQNNLRYVLTRSLGAGQSIIVNSSNPFRLPAGMYIITSNADWFSNVTEKSETNNEKIINFTLGPDLVITKINFTSRQEGNGTNYTVTFNAIIKNIGTYSAGRSTARFEVLNRGFKYVATDSLSVNAERLLISTFTVPQGNHTAVVTADWFSNVTEADETNNERRLSFRIP